MMENIAKLKNNLKIVLLIYFFSMMLSSLIVFILNIKEGYLTFNNNLGDWIDIFFHNLKIHVLLIFGGIIFSIPSIIILIFNGLISGFYISQSIVLNESGALFKNIFMHGFLEMPATLLSVAVSLQVTYYCYSRVFKKRLVLLRNFSFHISVPIIIVLTLLAAIIEGNI